MPPTSHADVASMNHGSARLWARVRVEAAVELTAAARLIVLT
jgi:hypothetical protein